MKKEILKLAKEIEAFAELTSPKGPVATLVTTLRKADRHEEAKAIVDKCADKWREISCRALAIAERL